MYEKVRDLGIVLDTDEPTTRPNGKGGGKSIMPRHRQQLID